MPKTAKQVREEFQKQGTTIPLWASENGFPLRAVRAVIYGHNKGLRGQCHKIAVALGMKDAPK